jgi:CheY-like chemotaxis protein
MVVSLSILGTSMAYLALVVDDDPSSRFIYQQILTSLGFTVVSAADGARALELLEESPFDIVFLDMLLPRISGAELLNYARTVPHLRDTKFVVVSAHAGFKDSLTLNPPDQFLLKPVLSNAIREAAMNLVSSSMRSS